MTKLFGTNVQIAPIKQTAIQPAGLPGSTFVRAMQRQTGGNASALASALSGLNSALNNYVGVKAQVEEDPQSRENQEWVARRGQMSLDQLRQEAENQTPDGIRVREDALNLMLGERANDDFRKRWMEFYNTEFDRTSGDAAGEYERMRQEFAAGLPTEIAKGNFYRLTKDHFSAWMEKDTEERVSLVKQELNTTIVDGFRNSVDDALNLYGKTPQEAAEIVFQKSAQNRSFLGLSGKEQNDTVFALAQEYANQGNEAMARGLLEGQRTGADGRKLPSLISIPGYADRAYTLIEQAAAKADKTFREENLPAQIADDDMVARGAFTEDEARKRMGKTGYTAASLSQMVAASKQNLLQMQNKAAVEDAKRERRRESERQRDQVISQAYTAMERMGGINDIHDIEIASPSGEGTVRMTRQDIIDRVTSIKEAGFDDMQESFIAKGVPEADARQQVNRHRLDWYVGHKLPNETWSNTLNGIGGRASIDTLLQKGAVTEYLKDSARLYRDLKEVNAAYLSTILTDDASREFLETYDRAVKRRVPEDNALLYAAQQVAMPSGMKARNMLSHEATDALVRRTLRELELDDRPANSAIIAERVASLSALGATEQEIKRTIEEDILDTAVPIHGVLVFDHRDLPKDFPELIVGELQKWFEKNGEDLGVEGLEDLYVVPDQAEARWFIFSKHLPGWPVSAEPITPQSLNAARREREQAYEDEIRELIRAENEDRADRAHRRKLYYDRDLRDQERLNYWRGMAAKRGGLRKTYADTVADDLERTLGERRARYSAAARRVEQQKARNARAKQGTQE